MPVSRDEPSPKQDPADANEPVNQASVPSAGPQTHSASARVTVDRKLLDLLVCPVTKSVLHYDHDQQELISYAAKVAYPIRDSIPIMLIEEARELSDAEIAKHKAGRRTENTD